VTRAATGDPDLYRYFFGAYPTRTALMIGCMVVAGLAEGVGVLTLIPVLQVAEGGPAAEQGVGGVLRDLLANVGLEPTLPVLLVFIVLAITVKAMMLQLAQKQVGYTVAGVTRDLRLRLLRGVLGARWSYVGERKVGQFANAIASEANRASSAYREAAEVVAAFLQMTAYLIVAMLVSWPLALAAALAAAGMTWFARQFFERSRAAGDAQTAGSKSLTARLVDILQGIKPLKAMGRQGLVWPFLEGETEAINRAQREGIAAYETLRAFHEPILTLFLAIGMYVVLGMTQLPMGQTLVLAFVFYRLVTHVNSLQLRYQTMLVGESAFKSIREETSAAEAHREPTGGKVVPGRLREGIVFENVHFSYGSESDVLSGISLEIPRGHFVAIHGKSGSGKTTLVDLLVGLHHPEYGRILVDGVPLSELDLDAWRKQVGYVPQETLLFNTSILENVTLGDPALSTDDAEEALRLAQAWEFVEATPMGLHTGVGERGGNLSGGQRQRLALARALVAKPSVLILDEVTTALDPEAEQAICSTLRMLAGSITIISISHQPALRAVADLVYGIDSGQVELLPTLAEMA
jgi:ATP-binding cassette subfamily C protein